MGRPTARGPAPPPAPPPEPPPDQPPPDQPPPEDLTNFYFDGAWYRIPVSVYNQILEIERTTPDSLVMFELIGNLLIPYGYVPPEPPEDLVSFDFQGVTYWIPQSVYDQILEINRNTPDAAEAFRLINILLIPYGAPPVR